MEAHHLCGSVHVCLVGHERLAEVVGLACLLQDFCLEEGEGGIVPARAAAVLVFDAGNLQEMAERFREREGHYPSRIPADKIYRNRENLSYCKEHGIRLSGPALGRPRKGETRDKAQDYRDECERVEVARKFSLAKRKCGMGLVTAKLRETAAHVIAMSVLVLNLRKIQCAILRLLTYLLVVFPSQQKTAVVQ